MRKKKESRSLPEQPRKKRPKFVMSAPNEDIDAYGWELRQIRLPSADDKHVAGRPAFNIKQDIKSIKQYGVDVQFVCPKYLQMVLDAEPAVGRAIEKAKAAGWTPEALKSVTNTVTKVFNERVLVDIAQRFYNVAPMVAEFYAARQAHIDLFGKPQEDESDDDQIEANTTKSRR